MRTNQPVGTMLDPSTGRTVIGPRDGGPAGMQDRFQTAPAQFGPMPTRQPGLFKNVTHSKGTVLVAYDAVYPMPEPGAVFQVAPEHVTYMEKNLTLEGKIVRVDNGRVQQQKFTVPPGYKLVREDAPEDGEVKLAVPNAAVPNRVAQQHDNTVAARQTTPHPSTTFAEPAAPVAELDLGNDDMDDNLFINADIPDDFVEAMTDHEVDDELAGILGDIDDTE